MLLVCKELMFFQLIRVHEKTSEFIHPTNKELDSARCSSFGRCEVNCSLEATPWNICLYRKAKPYSIIRNNTHPAKEINITAGQLIMLQDTNNVAHVSLSVDPSNLGNVETAEVVLVPELQALLESAAFCSDLVHSGNVGTSSLWLVEKAVVFQGGDVHLRNDLVTLKYLNSNLFMKMDGTGRVRAVRGRENAGLFTFRLVNAKSGSDENSKLYSDSEVVLESEGLWIGLQDNSGDDSKASKTRETFSKVRNPTVKHAHKNLAAKTERSSAISLNIRMYNNASNVGSFSTKSLQLNVHVGVAATSLLRGFQNSSKVFSSGIPNSFELGLYIQSLFLAFSSLNDFLLQPTSNDKAQNASHDRLKLLFMLDPIRAIDRMARQSMLCEQGFLDALLDVIELTASDIYDHPALAVTKISNIYDHKKLRVQPQRKASITERKSLLGNVDAIISASGDVPPRLTPIQTTSPLEESKVGEKSGALFSHTTEKKDLEDSEETSLSRKIANSCLQCLLKCLEGNSANQLYISDRILVILNQVRKKQNLAILCLQELLHNNISILQTKIRSQEIDVLIEIMFDIPMDPSLLSLIRRTLTSPRGVDATQRMVTYSFFGRVDPSVSISNAGGRHGQIVRKTMMRTSALIKESETDSTGMAPISDDLARSGRQLIVYVYLDKSKLVPYYWSNTAIYTPKSDGKDGDSSEILMDFNTYNSLYSKGLPDVWVSWAAKDECSMLSLFGCHEKVPLTLLCDDWVAAKKYLSGGVSTVSTKPLSIASTLVPRSPSSAKTSSSKRQNIFFSSQVQRLVMQSATPALQKQRHLLKKQIGDYFITQLYLLADLCLDRNYVAIGIIQRHFTYEMLLTIVKREEIPNQFKAAASRLIRCLFVDREPQTAANFPRFIRSIVKRNPSSGEGNAEFFENNYPYKFSLLQQIISEYLEIGLSAAAFDELSAEMLGLLETLFHFGFYTTPQQIQNVLKPLNLLLENHDTVGKELRSDDTTKETVAIHQKIFNVRKICNFLYSYFGVRKIIPIEKGNLTQFSSLIKLFS